MYRDVYCDVFHLAPILSADKTSKIFKGNLPIKATRLRKGHGAKPPTYVSLQGNMAAGPPKEVTHECTTNHFVHCH